MKNFKEKLEKLLKKEKIFLDDKNEIDYIKVKDSADKIDPKLIEILISNKEAKNKFFTKIKDVFVFNINDFKFFLEESKVDNSYTAYKNRIGLTDGKKFLKDTNDVVLDFPYKDCVLEGGQSTEEGADIYFEYEQEKTKTVKGEKVIEEAGYREKQGKRKEIFFNSVLAHDEIDRLFDHKALTNWKRWTKDGEQKVKEIKRDEDGTIKENLIIKGNNLLALHSLKKQFTGKIKLIYIDPPYNTGGDANTFAYNNTFNHSSWLTFMKNRIEVAKNLLRPDGVICIAIDDEEYAHLKVLIDDIFNRENYLGTVVIQSNPRGRTINSEFATCHEYCLFYAKDKNVSKINNIDLTENQIEDFKHKDEIGHYRYLPFRRSGGTSTPKERPNSEFSLYYSINNNRIIAVGGDRNDEFNKPYKPKFILTLDDNSKLIKHDPIKYLKEHKNIVEILPIDTSGKRRVWRWSDRLEILKSVNNNDFNVVVKGDQYTVQLKDRIKEGRKPKTIWHDSKYDASSSGTILLKKIFDGNKLFSYPKSIYTVLDTIKITTELKSNDIVLDFFGGSGTTAHAVLELNKEDGGNRKFIMIEQMDYINTVTCPRVQKVMEKENIDDSFIYFELAKWNETAKEKILACKSLNEIIIFFDEMYERYFLNYNLKIKEFREKVIKEEEFKNLSLDEQKKMFVAMLDNNQMYVNESEMEDEKFKINKEDTALTKEFYNNK